MRRYRNDEISEPSRAEPFVIVKSSRNSKRKLRDETEETLRVSQDEFVDNKRNKRDAVKQRYYSPFVRILDQRSRVSMDDKRVETLFCAFVR